MSDNDVAALRSWCEAPDGVGSPPAKATILALLAERDRLASAYATDIKAAQAAILKAASDRVAAEAALRKSEERAARLEKALKPFDAAAHYAETDEPPEKTLFSSSARHRITLADLFCARAALAKEPAA